jgi:hypothetical protein
MASLITSPNDIWGFAERIGTVAAKAPLRPITFARAIRRSRSCGMRRWMQVYPTKNTRSPDWLVRLVNSSKATTRSATSRPICHRPTYCANSYPRTTSSNRTFQRSRARASYRLAKRKAQIDIRQLRSISERLASALFCSFQLSALLLVVQGEESVNI